jgi:transposase
MRQGAGSLCIDCSKLEPLPERDVVAPVAARIASMSQNNLTIIYAGLDVAKATLQLHLQARSASLPNTPTGHARLVRMLSDAAAAQAASHCQVIIEATGGYEAAVVEALHAAGQRLSVIQPARARSFARARANHAKTDPIDAALLAEFGQRLQPPPTPAPSAAQRRLLMLVVRRSQLISARVAESNRAEHYTEPMLRRQSAAYLRLLARQITDCEKAIAAQLAADPAMQTRTKRLQQVPGIGPVVAAVLQAHLPELGTVANGEAAALAGLAPYNRDSGTFQGVRFVRGGRTQVRTALYMAALTAIRFDPILRTFYRRLTEAGKPKMVALTAVMRKLLVLLNRLLAKPNFKLQALAPAAGSAACSSAADQASSTEEASSPDEASTDDAASPPDPSGSQATASATSAAKIPFANPSSKSERSTPCQFIQQLAKPRSVSSHVKKPLAS